jgi:hypothetical protein
MTDPIAEAAERAAEYGAPPKTWRVPENAHIEFSDGPGDHPFNGMTIAGWLDNI